MKLLFLMVLLTRNGAGDLNAAFVNTLTLAECEQRMLAVKGIFLSAGVDVAEARCVRSGLRFSPFEHAVSSRQQRHFYLLRFAPADVRITLRSGWRDCMQGAEDAGSESGIYCASSVQRLLD